MYFGEKDKYFKLFLNFKIVKEYVYAFGVSFLNICKFYDSNCKLLKHVSKNSIKLTEILLFP